MFVLLCFNSYRSIKGCIQWSTWLFWLSRMGSRVQCSIPVYLLYCTLRHTGLYTLQYSTIYTGLYTVLYAIGSGLWTLQYSTRYWTIHCTVLYKILKYTLYWILWDIRPGINCTVLYSIKDYTLHSTLQGTGLY